jgi:hypothetical protein
MMGMHVLIVGNPVDGLKFYGPYKTGDEAIDAGERIDSGSEWWVAKIEELTE